MFSILTAEVTPFLQNCRFVFDSESGKGTVVDPGGEADILLEIARIVGILELEVLLTHAHLDHAGGVSRLMQLWEEHSGVRPILSAHAAEREMRSTVAQQALLFGLSSKE